MKATLMLVTTIVIGVLLMETGVRVLNLHEPLIWAPDAEFGWNPIPGAKRLYTNEGYGEVAINALGYRDRQRAIAKTPGTTRIGVFGDSQTEAIQVHLDQTYHYRLQEMFTANEQNVEVLNFGVTGYSPAQVLLTLQQEIERYDLDIIVVSLFLDNDVSGSVPELSVSTTGTPFIVPGISPVAFDYSRSQQSHQDFFKEPKHTIRKYSGLYRFIFKIKNSMTQCGENCQTKPVPTRYELYRQQPADIWSQAWEAFDQTVLEIKRLVESHNKALVLLSIPAGQTVNQLAWNNILNQHPAMSNETWDLYGAEKRLGEFASTHSMQLIQPYEQFVASASDTKLHFGNVGHLTSEGHKKIAQHAFPILENLLKTTGIVNE